MGVGCRARTIPPTARRTMTHNSAAATQAWLRRSDAVAAARQQVRHGSAAGIPSRRHRSLATDAVAAPARNARAASFETHRHSRPKDGVALLAYGDAPRRMRKEVSTYARTAPPMFAGERHVTSNGIAPGPASRAPRRLSAATTGPACPAAARVTFQCHSRLRPAAACHRYEDTIRRHHAKARYGRLDTEHLAGTKLRRGVVSAHYCIRAAAAMSG